MSYVGSSFWCMKMSFSATTLFQYFNNNEHMNVLVKDTTNEHMNVLVKDFVLGRHPV